MSDSSNRDFWQQTYQSGEFLQHWDYSSPSQELVAAVAAGIVKQGGVALDVGCGAGREAIFLAQCGLRVIDRHFRAPAFSRGPVLPITLVSDGGTLVANLVVLRKS